MHLNGQITVRIHASTSVNAVEDCVYIISGASEYKLFCYMLIPVTNEHGLKW